MPVKTVQPLVALVGNGPGRDAHNERMRQFIPHLAGGMLKRQKTSAAADDASDDPDKMSAADWAAVRAAKTIRASGPTTKPSFRELFHAHKAKFTDTGNPEIRGEFSHFDVLLPDRVDGWNVRQSQMDRMRPAINQAAQQLGMAPQDIILRLLDDADPLWAHPLFAV